MDLKEKLRGLDVQSIRLTVVSGLIAVLLLGSCKTQKTTQTKQTQTQTIRQEYLGRIDTIKVRDTIKVYQRGDSVFVEKIVYNDRIIRDTITKADTRKDKEIEIVEKEKKTSIYEKILTAFDVIMFILLIVVGGKMVRKKIRLWTR